MNARDIELAKQAGFVLFDDYADSLKNTLERFATLIRADESDAIAEMCENTEIEGSMGYGWVCAEHIRARGNT